MAYIASFAVPALLVVFAFLVWKASPDRQLNRRFTTFTLVAALWAAAVTAAHGGTHITLSVPISFAAGSLIPVMFLAFIYAYPPAAGLRARRALLTWVALGLTCSLLSLTTNLIVFDPSKTGNTLSRKPGPLYSPFAFFIVATWTMAIGVFISKWRAARGRSRAELQYLAAGMIVPGLAGMVTNVLMPWITGRSLYGAIGPYFALSFVLIIGHALIRHRITDLRLVLHSGLTLAIATIVSSVPAVVLLLVFGPRLLGHLALGELAFALVTIGLVIIMVPPTRDIARRLLDRYVYRTRANYQRTVREASKMLTRVLDLKRLLPFISKTVVEATGVEGVVIYLQDEDGFRRAMAQRRNEASDLQAPETAPASVIAALARVQEPLVADEVARQIVTDADRMLSDDLVATNWALLLPVISDDGLIAFIAVGSKLSGDPFYQQDLDLLMTLANQAGIAIKNAQLYAAMVVANEYLENIVATLESGVIAINATGQIAIFNRAAKELTGLSAAATETWDASILPACLADPLLATVRDGDPRVQPEVELATSTGHDEIPVVRPVICTTSPVRDPAGTVLGAVAVFSDLTPLKELETQRRSAERLVYFQTLAAGIAHEIKNPLVAIKTFTQLLPRRRQDSRFLDEFGRIAVREIDRMQRIVDRLSALSRPANGPRDVLDIRGPLADALEFIQPTLEEKNISLSISLAIEPCFIISNTGELEQLFLNMLLNAYDANPSGGTVSVEATRKKAEVIIEVSDTGAGIAPEVLDRLFEPFFTTKARGSGLGLAISSGIAQAHGGQLRAVNRPAGGAMLSVEFPIATSASA